MFSAYKLILIGGTSHVGKSTLAQSLASYLNWNYLSTDTLARHPGRPWRAKPQEVPRHVAAHYLSLSADQLLTDVLRHYKDKVGPLITNIVTSYTTNTLAENLVMEGSAILPELVVSLDLDNAAAIWLTASQELIEQRIYAASQYGAISLHQKIMVDKFLARTLLYDEQTMSAVNRLGLMRMNIESAANIHELTDMCLAAFNRQASS